MTSYLLFMYRQNGSDRIMGATADAQGDWRDGSFEMTYNPVTNKQWSASEVNAGLEWGFRSWFPQLTPRVTQSYLEVTYRVPTESTVYIGGVYEEKDDGSVTKYYSLNGRTIALRKVGAGGGAGTLFYLLADHLGSTVELLDSSGVTVTNSEVKYWPYGSLRSGGVTETDRMFTGQRDEPGDVLGLYNFEARFYSPTLGNFVSADVNANDGLNRFGYAKRNPLRFMDPSGGCVTWAGERLPCTAAIAMNWLACAIDIHACTRVQAALGYRLSPALTNDAHRWARAAVFENASLSAEFWLNFTHPSIIPYRNRGELYDAYGYGLANDLMDIGRQYFTPRLERQTSDVWDRIDEYCGQRSCATVAVNILELGFGLYGPQYLERYMVNGLGLGEFFYATEVQVRWLEYRENPNDQTYYALWSTIVLELHVAYKPGSEEREFFLTMLSLWDESVCGSQQCY